MSTPSGVGFSGIAMSADWFAGRLRELRENAGLSRKELAERAGMQSEAGIRNIEQGIRKPSWETVIALAQALGVDCNAFTEPPATGAPEPKGGRPRKKETSGESQAEPSESEPSARKPKKGKSGKKE